MYLTDHDAKRVKTLNKVPSVNILSMQRPTSQYSEQQPISQDAEQHAGECPIGQLILSINSVIDIPSDNTEQYPISQLIPSVKTMANIPPVYTDQCPIS